MTKTNKPHVHAEAIKAWADGKTIQFKMKDSDEWGEANCSTAGQFLMFCTDYFYRIKPEEVIDYALVYGSGVVATQFYPRIEDIHMAAHACHYDFRQGFVKRTRLDGQVVSFEFIPK